MCYEMLEAKLSFFTTLDLLENYFLLHLSRCEIDHNDTIQNQFGALKITFKMYEI